MASVIFYFAITMIAGLGGASAEGCSTTCGRLGGISYPFRLSGDPPTCGDPDHELICDGDNAIFKLKSHNFFVTDISYQRYTLNVVDISFARGICRFPDQFISPRDVEDAGYGSLFSSVWGLYQVSWISFLNCSEEKVQENYWSVPCLSHGNNTFIYATYGTEASIILPSCRFVGMAPTSAGNRPLTDVFRLLQQGFQITWNVISRPYVLDCLKVASQEFTVFYFLTLSRTSSWILAPFSFGSAFEACIQRNPYGYADQGLLRRIILSLSLDPLLLNILLVIALTVKFVLSPLVVLIFLAHKYWKMRRPINIVEKFLRNQQTLSTKRYAYTDIIAITSHFREKLGQGGFGSVFKGELPGGRMVAVKMLNDSLHNGEEFISEVSTIGSIHHVNVVKLVGFCAEGSKRALVYNYMPKGSLDKYIFSSDGSVHRPFSWGKLNDIALGIARGIDYLHRGCEMRILHFDIKPQNVLLDQNFNPKISDFGLARLYPKGNSMITISAARGTIGYMAPELISRSFGVVSYKSDVYSFGMLLMEMAAGRRNVNRRVENSSQIYYPSWIYDQLKQHEEVEISRALDIGETERKLYMVGLWCIQMRPSDRPSMSKVVEMLEGDTSTLQLPPKPFFSTLRSASMKLSFSGTYDDELSTISEH